MGIFQEKEQSGQKIPQVTRFYTNTIIGNSFFLKTSLFEVDVYLFRNREEISTSRYYVIDEERFCCNFFFILKHISELQML